MIAIDRYRCGYCGACVSVCPNDAIDLIETFIEIDGRCVDCGICTRACPMGALEIENEE